MDATTSAGTRTSDLGAKQSPHRRDPCRRGAVRPESDDHGWQEPAPAVARVSRRPRADTSFARKPRLASRALSSRGSLGDGERNGDEGATAALAGWLALGHGGDREPRIRAAPRVATASPGWHRQAGSRARFRLSRASQTPEWSALGLPRRLRALARDCWSSEVLADRPLCRASAWSAQWQPISVSVDGQTSRGRWPGARHRARNRHRAARRLDRFRLSWDGPRSTSGCCSTAEPEVGSADSSEYARRYGRG